MIILYDMMRYEILLRSNTQHSTTHTGLSSCVSPFTFICSARLWQNRVFPPRWTIRIKCSVCICVYYWFWCNSTAPNDLYSIVQNTIQFVLLVLLLLLLIAQSFLRSQHICPYCTQTSQLLHCRSLHVRERQTTDICIHSFIHCRKMSATNF